MFNIFNYLQIKLIFKYINMENFEQVGNFEQVKNPNIFGLKEYSI